MNQRLKRWESPRREGRNDKGRGGSARARQLKKQTQMLRRRLKEGGEQSPNTEKNKRQGEETLILPPDFFGTLSTFSYGSEQLYVAKRLYCLADKFLAF